MADEEIPQTRILDLFTKIDNLIAIQIKTSRRTNELLEMLLGVRPAPPEIVLPPAAVPPRVPEIRVPEISVPEWGIIRSMLEPVTDYLSEEKDAPQSYELKEILHRSALNGYIANGGPGNLNVKINTLGTIRVANGEILDLTPYTKRPLEINKVELSSPTTATFRILLW